MSFEKLLTPQSVAVVGASANPSKVGHAVLNNILAGGFEGDIYPINPKGGEILGRRCFTSLAEVPGSIDLALVIIKRDLVLPVLKECAQKSVGAAIIITAGFGEIGPEGKKHQEEISRFVRQKRITMMGPNCLGLINPWHKLNASFGQKLRDKGPIALISQSGALITGIQDIAAAKGQGFSLLASIGNKATLNEVDFLEQLKDDTHTRVIAAYLEDITDGQEFMKVAERVSKTKPVVVLKSGRTAAGAKAASSHTGSLAGADAAYDSAFGRTGIIRAQSIDHLFDVAMGFAYQPLPRGDRVAVVTNAGGPGIMMSDALEMAGLTVARLDDATRERLEKVLPPAGSPHNPVDVLGDANGETYGKAIDVLLASESVDSVAVILTPQKMTEDKATAQAIVDTAGKYDKPVLACFIGADMVKPGIEILRANKIPQYPIPERAAMALAEMVGYARFKNRPLRTVDRFAVNKNPVVKVIRAYRAKKQLEIGEADAKTILRAYDFTIPPGDLVTSVDEAARSANEIGYPLAMKISSPDILHKSDVGGVKIGLQSASDVRDAYELMMLRIGRAQPDADLRGVVIEKMVTGGREVILGMKKDPQFGPMLMFGLGGIFVEVLKDVTFNLAPITAGEARRMIEKTKSYRLLTGVRGKRGVDIPAIVENLQRMSQLVMDFSEVDEIDINPLKVGYEGDGATVVDARIILHGTE
ncbi:MAG: CoA-binding protein [Chitinivibrionales bacterium]|nr:CoA-binding protein [Chitinivibrionales bacterium]MBD3394989.1 CoA-binding protein [Chitinivibrionales bacterium]